MKKSHHILFILFLSLTSLDSMAQDSTRFSHSFGVSWNVPAVVYNYPYFQFAVAYNWKNQLSIEFGGNRLLDSENNIAFFTQTDEIEHKEGYRLLGELKYYFDMSDNGSSFYTGVGYSYLNSSFQLDYVVRRELSGERYYQNVDQVYTTVIQQLYAKIGYRVSFIQERFYFDAGFNLGYSDRNMTPEVTDLDGEIVTHGTTVTRISEPSNLAMFVEAKLCIRFARWK